MAKGYTLDLMVKKSDPLHNQVMLGWRHKLVSYSKNFSFLLERLGITSLTHRYYTNNTGLEAPFADSI